MVRGLKHPRLSGVGGALTMEGVKLPVLAFSLLLLGALLGACGVKYGADSLGNEFFNSLTVTGDMRVGHPLTGFVRFRQAYPTDISVRCELRQGKDLLRKIGEDTVKAHPSGGPKATPFPGSASYDFTIDTPGHYKFECFTPADEDNYIIKEFDVGPAPAASPTPIPNDAMPVG